MNQWSAVVGIVVGIGVFYALLSGDFIIILMSGVTILQNPYYIRYFLMSGVQTLQKP